MWAEMWLGYCVALGRALGWGLVGWSGEWGRGDGVSVTCVLRGWGVGDVFVLAVCCSVGSSLGRFMEALRGLGCWGGVSVWAGFVWVWLLVGLGWGAGG